MQETQSIITQSLKDNGKTASVYQNQKIYKKNNRKEILKIRILKTTITKKWNKVWNLKQSSYFISKEVPEQHTRKKGNERNTKAMY